MRKIRLLALFAFLMPILLMANTAVGAAGTVLLGTNPRFLPPQEDGYILATDPLVWKTTVEPGVYNVILRYTGSDQPMTVRLEISDGRVLQSQLAPGKTPSASAAPAPMVHSLGPLAFDRARECEFRLRLADPSEKGSVIILEMAFKRIGGAEPSVSVAPPAETGEQSAQRINPLDGAELVWIPEGPFTMGGLAGNDAHTVSLAGFWIYKFPVTVGQYRQFCESTQRQMPSPPKWGWIDNHPMVNVSWYEALAYAKWAETRLPSEAEWEKAARGTDGRVLPWGNDFDTAKCQSDRDLHGFPGTTPVGFFPGNVSPYGARDMAGNVWQWCSSRIAPYPYRADDGREELSHIKNEKRTYLGGGWVRNSWRNDWMILHRGNFYPQYTEKGRMVDLRRDHIGFRCAQSLPR